MARLLLPAILAILLLPTGSSNGEMLTGQSAHGDEVVAFANEFRRAVLSKDESYLQRLSAEAGGLDEHTWRFIYDDSEARLYLGPAGRSISTILSAPKLVFIYEGAIDGRAQSGASYIIYFVDISIDDVARPEYRVPWLVTNKMWMKDYVACRIARRRDQWLMQGSFCFAETEGPW